MNMTEFIGYFAASPGDRAILNEDASVMVFGEKHDFINYLENHPEKNFLISVLAELSVLMTKRPFHYWPYLVRLSRI